MSALDFLASAYLTDYRGTDRDEIEDRASAAAGACLQACGVSFDDAMRAAAAKAEGEDAPVMAWRAYEAALAASCAAVARDIACAPGAFVSLGWR